MNTMGKILVFVILVLSLATVGFHVLDAAIRTNWKAAYDSMEARYKGADANRRNWEELYQKKQEEYEKVENKLKQSAAFFQQKEKELVEAFQKEQKKSDQLQIDLSDASTSGKVSNEERKRLQKESKDLNDRLEVALKQSIDKEKVIAEARQEAVEAKNERNSLILRNESLLDQIESLQKTLAKRQYGSDSVPLETVREASNALKAGKADRAQEILSRAYERASSLTSVRDPNAPNPPTGYLEGVITKVHEKDKTLVEISIGSDVGLSKDQTLEVYRLSPKAEYLGRIRIIDVNPHSAVGRLVRSEFTGRRSPLQKGDTVASRINR
jgi:chromosome segregation ATPase